MGKCIIPRVADITFLLGSNSSRDIGIGYRLGDGTLTAQTGRSRSWRSSCWERAWACQDVIYCWPTSGEEKPRRKKPASYHRSRLDSISFSSSFPLLPSLLLFHSSYPSSLFSYLLPFLFFFLREEILIILNGSNRTQMMMNHLLCTTS